MGTVLEAPQGTRGGSRQGAEDDRTRWLWRIGKSSRQSVRKQYSRFAVATLERDFEDTLVYSQLDTVTQEWIRTTSLLERTNRELRRTFRQAVTLGSMTGADAALFLQVQRLHARWTDGAWWQVSRDLYFELHP